MPQNQNMRHISLGGVIVILVFSLLLFGALGFALGINVFKYFGDNIIRVEQNENSQILSPSPEPTPSPVNIQKDASYLEIEWFEVPINIKAEVLGLKMPSFQSPPWEGLTLDDIFTVHRVGKVVGGTFSGDDFYILERSCLGPCGKFHYRVIDDRKNQGLVLLKSLSNQIDPDDRGLFILTEQYDIETLHLPQKISVKYEEKLLHFTSEDFSPAVMFEEYVKNKILDSELSHPIYKTLYQSAEAGNFIIKLPDHTIKLYRLDLPFHLNDDPSAPYLGKTALLDIRFSPPGTVLPEPNYPLYYTPMAKTVCPPAEYEIYREPGDTLKNIGALSSGEELFIPKDPDHTLNKTYFESYYKNREISYEKFIGQYPVILMRDAMDRMMILRKSAFLSPAETECPYFNSVL